MSLIIILNLEDIFTLRPIYNIKLASQLFSYRLLLVGPELCYIWWLVGWVIGRWSHS